MSEDNDFPLFKLRMIEAIASKRRILMVDVFESAHRKANARVHDVAEHLLQMNNVSSSS